MDKSNQRPLCIVISGIDGSGKTTVINSLQSHFKNKGFRTVYIWLRFNHYLTKVMHALARLAGISIMVHNEMGDTWQHRFYRSPMFCSVYILTTYIDALISRLKYNRAAKHSDIVICDRWVTDILVDLATKTHRTDFLGSKWVSRFLNILPNNSYLFVVYRHTQNVVECRVENRVDPDFEFRLNIYKELLNKEYVHPINNCGEIETSVAQVVKILEL